MPPTVILSIKRDGWPTPTGTPCPDLPQVPIPGSSIISLPTIKTSLRDDGPSPIKVAPFKGAPILPSKRARKTPEKIQVTKEDLAELPETAKADVDSSVGEETVNEEGEVSLEEVSNSEEPAEEDTQEDQ